MCCCAYMNNYASVGTITVSATSALLVPDQALSPTNTERVYLRLTTTPSGTVNVPVTVTLNGADVPVYDKAGNIVYGNQLQYGMLLAGYYGTNGAGGTAHLQLVNFPRNTMTAL